MPGCIRAGKSDNSYFSTVVEIIQQQSTREVQYGSFKFLLNLASLSPSLSKTLMGQSSCCVPCWPHMHVLEAFLYKFSIGHHVLCGCSLPVRANVAF
jgi:hypothetical protein